MTRLDETRRDGNRLVEDFIKTAGDMAEQRQQDAKNWQTPPETADIYMRSCRSWNRVASELEEGMLTEDSKRFLRGIPIGADFLRELGDQQQ